MQKVHVYDQVRTRVFTLFKELRGMASNLALRCTKLNAVDVRDKTCCKFGVSSRTAPIFALCHHALRSHPSNPFATISQVPRICPSKIPRFGPCTLANMVETMDAWNLTSFSSFLQVQQFHLGCHFRKLKAQSSNVFFATFQWKETFELWALSFEKAFENVTPGGIGCNKLKWTSRFWWWHPQSSPMSG